MTDTSEKREEPAGGPAPVTSEAPAAPADEPVSQATEASAGPEGAPLAADAPPHRQRRRRRRRRRHGPKPPGEQASGGAAPTPPASAGGASGEAATLPSSDAALQPTEGAAAPEPGAANEAAPGAPSTTPPGEQPRRRRRRRRRRKPPPGAEAGSPGAIPEGVAAVATGEQSAATDARPPQKPWRGRPRWRQREGENDNRDPRAREGGTRTEGPRGNRDHGKRDRDRRDKRHQRSGKPGFGRGRDRDGHGKKPEQKLYASESIVDHGFEDVAPIEEGGETRRIDWSIVKRMMVDQRSTRSISTVYVLKRDGTETEFPYLAAAREAVNKKIVHPEKLTKPKEEYAALYTKK